MNTANQTQPHTEITIPEITIPSRDLTFSELYGSLLEVVTPKGVQASSDHLFRAVFGRDSLRVALDLYPWHPDIAEKVLVSLAVLQGKKINEMSEEEPGRILHEYRSLYLNGVRITEEQEQIMVRLAERWGWLTEGAEMCYYGAVDSTPQFVRLAYLYVRQYGRGYLETRIRHHDGSEFTIGIAVLNALDWVEKRVKYSDIGLLEFQRTNPRGHRWQVMRDGTVSYLHENGHLANYQGPIASLEVQGLAYDALVMGAELFEEELPERAAEWRRLAAELQKQTLERFWMEDQNFFAMALDRDPEGQPRLVTTATSVPAEILDSGLFDGLPNGEREHYVASIVRAMYSESFLTAVGIRSRAVEYGNLLPYWDYQGSFTSWAVTTNVFALGLRRQGLVAHAFDMEKRLLNAVNIAGCLPEFFYVDGSGRVHYSIHHRTVPAIEQAGEPERIRATNQPELNQAWTISAVLRAKLARRDARRAGKVKSSYESKLKRKTGLRRVGTKLLRGNKIPNAYPNYASLVDRDGGMVAEQEYIEAVLAQDV
jgi:glycogen debranching enzyme